METLNRKRTGQTAVSDNQSSSVTLNELAKKTRTSSPKGNDRAPESHYTCCKFALKQLFTIPTRILSMMMCIQKFVSFCQFVLKILSKNQNLTSIKGSYSVANLRKTKIYNTNIDLVNDNVYTKFGLNLFILSQDIEQKPNSDTNQKR